jgi:hypothetical protein
MKKRGSIELSFGMIFSIILVIVFIAVAIYGIKKFLDFQNDLKISQFKDNLQKDIDDIWRSSEGSYPGKYSLPSKVVSVCFTDDAYQNLVFNPDNIAGTMINHIDIAKTLGGQSSVCFDNTNGEVDMQLGKNYGESLVTIK